jgi:hypothetical protein
MDFYGYDRAAATARCASLAHGQPGSKADRLCTWNRVRPEHVVQLLQEASAEARAEARSLAGLISRTPWRIQVQAPVAGKANQLVSNVREIALSAAGREYRLQCTQAPFLRLERIVQVG